MNDDLERGVLANRLRHLRLPGSDAVLERALAEAGRTRMASGRRRWAMVATVAAGLIVLVAFSPIAQAAAGPFSAVMLRWVGIPAGRSSSPAPGQQIGATATGQQTSATVGGYTVTVVGSYADSMHTAILLHTNRPASHGHDSLGTAMLQDENGREIAPRAGHVATDNDMALVFAGMTPGPHEVTLTVDRQWVLRFRLQVEATSGTPSPSSGSLHGVSVAIKDAGGANDVILSTIETKGATMEELGELSGSAVNLVKGPDPFRIQLFGPAGQELKPVQAGGHVASRVKNGRFEAPHIEGGVMTGVDPGHVIWTDTWPGAGAGTYHLVLTYKGDRFESAFTIN